MEYNSDCFVYMMTNWNNKVLYVGMTHDLVRRVYEHKNGVHEGFTKKYRCTKLVYFTQFHMTTDAIDCEKRFKKLSRANKEKLIEAQNPSWRDLSEDFEE